MRALLLVAAFTFALPAQAKTEAERNQYYPTAKQSYDDCKAAIALGEKQDWKAFLATRCAAQFTASFWTFYKTLHMIPVEPMTEELRIQVDLHKQFSHRFCALKSLNKIEPMEFQLAKRAVRYYDTHAEQLNPDEPSPTFFLSAYDDPCTMEQP